MKEKINKHKHTGLRLLGLILIITGAIYFCTDFIIVAPWSSVKLAAQKSLTQIKNEPVWPDHGSGAIGAIGYDGVLARFGDQSARPIASLTKIITALMVLQAKPLSGDDNGPSLVFTQEDLDIYNQQITAGAAVKPVTIGGSMTEKQALETMLLPSAANYATTLANWAYGSVDAYLSAANSWLASHGLNDTVVVDASGLLAGNVSTPSDLIKLGKLALANSSLASIVAMKQATIPDLGTIQNSNYMLGTLGINGIKTGTTIEAGACILFSSVVDVSGQKVTIVGTLLGADNRSQQSSDLTSLLKSVRPGFHSVKLAARNQIFGTYTNARGQTYKLISAKDVNMVAWSNTPISYKVQAGEINFAKSGEQEGVVIFNVGGQLVRQPLVIEN